MIRHITANERQLELTGLTKHAVKSLFHPATSVNVANAKEGDLFRANKTRGIKIANYRDLTRSTSMLSRLL